MGEEIKSEQVEVKSIDSEQVFDMLPYVADIYEKTGFDDYRKELKRKYKAKDVKDVDEFKLAAAIDAVKFILKNSVKVKDEFFNIVAIAEQKKLEEVKRQSFVKTIQSVKKIFSDPELVDFFKEAMQ
ncbi:hypothetical protein [Alkalihalobacillus sp. BA299]|uniref:hypothetical protein n=1 Tax=Alkalihalobacillus sp. BA299 TaxID=2815938 RepID=UPI001ADB7FEE|nr:hypothetical protein [Alkalihalobacillus sp. BA299]